MKVFIFFIASALLLAPNFAVAQISEDIPLSVERQYLEKARVLEATPSTERIIEGTTITTKTQTITVEVLEGIEVGTIATFENDFTQVKAGELIYVRHSTGGFDPDTWSVSDPYRLHVLGAVLVVFIILVCIFGGIQGIRGFVSLIGSLFLIFYLLIPAIYTGSSPILVSIGVASLIIIVGSYVTHGVSRTTTSAMLGMILTVIVTGIATYLVIDLASLSGFTSEINVYLNFGTDGRISMIGLLFGGIMIGLLGVLYDIAIGQAVAVEELYRASATYTQKEVYVRALRIGREHIGALINTLAIAYVGASLPLLLLFQQSTVSIGYVINGEIFATEIIRILMGSIGLILAVPVTTLIASLVLSHAHVMKKAKSITSHTH